MDTRQPHGTTYGTRGTSRRALLKGFASGAAAAAFLAAGWTVEAAGRPEFTLDGNTIVDTPVNVVFLFGQPEDADAFEAYYLSTHVPLALKMPNFLRLEGCKAVSAADGKEAAFYRIATMSFASRADMEAAMASDIGRQAVADVANFASGGVTATIVGDILSTARAAGTNAADTTPSSRGIERRTP